MASHSQRRQFHQDRYLAYVLAAISLVIMAAAAGAAPLGPEANLSTARRLNCSNYSEPTLTFTSDSSTAPGARACAMYSGKISRATPIVRLHGDAHLEQFALTKDAWGLDDFDDSARGPAAIDIVRFLGSIDLLTRQRSWIKARDPLFDRFFDGYRRGFAEPDHSPPEPDIVYRLRSQAPITRAAFLKWAETKMEPMGDYIMNALVAGMDAFADILLAGTNRPASRILSSRSSRLVQDWRRQRPHSEDPDPGTGALR